MFGLMLSFVVCMHAAPASARCQQVELPFEGSMQQCLLFGQHAVAQWTNDHEGWRLRRGWRCLNGRAA